MGFYNKENCDFMKSMNIINMFTAGYIYYKRGLFFAIPHASVCVTSWFFWRNVENDFYKILDYSAVANTIFFTYYESFLRKKELPVSQILMGVLYSYFLSMHFKNIKNQNYCIYFHSMTYMIGNLGIMYTFH